MTKPPAVNTASLIEELEPDNKLWNEIPTMMPKAQRSKARILVHFMKGLVTLDNAGRIVFDNRTLANAIDVVKYLTAPLNYNVARPFDILPLYLHLKSNGLPSSGVAPGRDKLVLSNKEPRKRKPLFGSSAPKVPRLFYS